MIVVDERADNCVAHPKVTKLKCPTLAFLSPNTTTVLQPMNQGMIPALESNFNSILMVYDAWNKMSHSTIHNRYKHAEFVENHDASAQTAQNDYSAKFDDKDDVLLSLWIKNLNSDKFASPGMWEDYVEVDSAVLTSKESIDENIVNNIVNEQHKIDEYKYKEEVVEKVKPSAVEVLNAADLLSPFVHSNIESNNTKSAMCQRLLLQSK